MSTEDFKDKLMDTDTLPGAPNRSSSASTSTDYPKKQMSSANYEQETPVTKRNRVQDPLGNCSNPKTWQELLLKEVSLNPESAKLFVEANELKGNGGNLFHHFADNIMQDNLTKGELIEALIRMYRAGEEAVSARTLMYVSERNVDVSKNLQEHSEALSSSITHAVDEIKAVKTELEDTLKTAMELNHEASSLSYNFFDANYQNIPVLYNADNDTFITILETIPQNLRDSLKKSITKATTITGARGRKEYILRNGLPKFLKLGSPSSKMYKI